MRRIVRCCIMRCCRDAVAGAGDFLLPRLDLSALCGMHSEELCIALYLCRRIRKERWIKHAIHEVFLLVVADFLPVNGAKARDKDQLTVGGHPPHLVRRHEFARHIRGGRGTLKDLAVVRF